MDIVRAGILQSAVEVLIGLASEGSLRAFDLAKALSEFSHLRHNAARWPSTEQEKSMLEDAAWASASINESISNCSCHIKALLDRVRQLEELVSESRTGESRGKCPTSDVS